MSKQGGCACHIRTNRNCPDRQLIPREQITAKTQQKGKGKQDHSHTPVKFTRRFIRSSVKGTSHMHHHHKNHGMRSITVHVTQYITEGHDTLQVFHVVISPGHCWHIVKHE